MIPVAAICPACSTVVPIRVEVPEAAGTLGRETPENAVVVCTDPNCRATFLRTVPDRESQSPKHSRRRRGETFFAEGPRA